MSQVVKLSMTEEKARLRHEQFLEDEATGRIYRSYEGSVLGTDVEFRSTDSGPHSFSSQCANDSIRRAIEAAWKAGAEGKKLGDVCITGCTQYGNLTIGWNWER